MRKAIRMRGCCDDLLSKTPIRLSSVYGYLLVLPRGLFWETVCRILARPWGVYLLGDGTLPSTHGLQVSWVSWRAALWKANSEKWLWLHGRAKCLRGREPAVGVRYPPRH